MACRSYDDDDRYGSRGSKETQDKMDMLARIACRALTAPETINAVSSHNSDNRFDIGAPIREVLADSEVKVWWPKHKIADAAEQAQIKEEAEIAANVEKAKKDALSKLTEAEKVLLNLA